MAITTTTLAVAATAADLRLQVTSASGATVGGLIKVDQEFMVITTITSTLIDVRSRGALGTTAVAHNILAPVTFCLDADVPDVAAGQGRGLAFTKRDVVSYSTAGAIALPTRDTIVLLNGTSARAMTLADPSGVPDGTFLTILSTVGTVANTVDLATGYIGSDSEDVFTFANLGTSVTLMAYKGKWAHIGTSILANENASPTVA